MSSFHIRSILLATDLRDGANAILTGASALAARTGAELHVIHAVEFLTVPYSAVSAADDYLRLVHEAREKLDRLAEEIPSAGARPSTVEVREASAPRGIIERAGEVEADLIVIGPARKRAFGGAILGSTADRLLRSAQVPVLVLHDTGPLALRRVVVPLDLADPAHGALDQGLLWAASLAATNEQGELASEVRVLYVIPRRYEKSGASFPEVVIGPQLAIEIEDSRRRAGAAAAVPVHAETVWGDAPADEIIRYVHSHPTDLLVLGTHGYGAIGRALIGSVTSRIVRAASCPMLLVPPSMWAPGGSPI